MKSYKEWKLVKEAALSASGDEVVRTVTIEIPASLEEAFKAHIKEFNRLHEGKKKKMDLGDEIPAEDDEEEEDAPIVDDDADGEDDDAETGDGEVVDPSSEKDLPDEEGDEEMNPLLAKMKKMKKNMKKKMCADDKKGKKEKKDDKKHMTAEDNAWFSSVKNMLAIPPETRNDGLGVTEDALLPYIDINTGFAIPRPTADGEMTVDSE